jgi:hypothetical protein
MTVGGYVSDSDDAKRTRLSEIERTLASLMAQHDLTMSAFKFDEASALQHRITACEAERQALAATLPAASAPAGPEPQSGVVPVLARPDRRRRPPRQR